MKAVVFVVDDDSGVCLTIKSVGQLLALPVYTFPSAELFLESLDRDQPGCIILDLQMPGMTGLELLQRLGCEKVDLPVIMLTGHADVRIAVEAMTRGALTVMEKPFRLDELMAQIRRAITVNAALRTARARQKQVEERLNKLTPKEREVLDMVMAGCTNKQIAAKLFLSVRAVEDRRARLMKKLSVQSLAELMQLRTAPSE